VPLGRHKLDISESIFRLADYEAFLTAHADEIAGFRRSQQAAFAEERMRWEMAGISMDCDAGGDDGAGDELQIPDGHITIDSPVSGSVWKIHAGTGMRFSALQNLMILEAMKMEIPVEPDGHIEVVEILVAEGTSVRAGQPLIIAKEIPSI
jgi:urea carboxylase